ncbi:MAG: family 10 glycosylhydrolase [Bacteroidaceae bacterium]|nr:family 10 glycosylhydrolase [Bacteroidaceae bacterium]
MKKSLLFSLVLLLSLTVSAQTNTSNRTTSPLPQPKREFRGAWIQCVNGQFQGLGTERMQAELTRHLDALKQARCNVVIFQVRPEADALYASSLEPWSRFLTGQQGTPPSPYWDPLAWMITECHRRGMELHAWINPFRAKTKGTTALATSHPYWKDKSKFISYDDLLLFDPGRPENRDYIAHVCGDIVRRYDVDGLHIDDYFYPYPVAGKTFDDERTYQLYGLSTQTKADWRRENVNRFIHQLHDTLRAAKPWVKFGVSPFGIYHNAKAGDNIPGSATAGLQNYDDLYADVLHWVKQGWVDYIVPQLYWQIGHNTADYSELLQWWARYSSGRPVIIGQDVERTMQYADPQNPSVNQMDAKLRQQRQTLGIDGSCLWYSKLIADNYNDYARRLELTYHRYPALQPQMSWITDETPGKVRRIGTETIAEGTFLYWDVPAYTSWKDKPVKYVVYRFASKSRQNLADPSAIVGITKYPFCKIADAGKKAPGYYVVTALNRIQNEGLPAGKRVK